MIELKSCPFCGFRPQGDSDDCIYPIDHSRTVWNLVCYETGGGCGASVLGGSAGEVVERWNTRVEGGRN